MKDFIEKISTYNILNYIIPGAIFWFMYPSVCGGVIPKCETIDVLFAIYFIGMIIYGVGSVLVEPLYNKIKVIQFSNYSDFLEASKTDLKLETLSAENNTFRTMISLVLVLLVSKLFATLNGIIPTWIIKSTLLLLIAIVFSLLYKKRTDYIRKRVNKIITNSHSQTNMP